MNPLILQLFQDQVGRHPDAPAVEDNGSILSYRALDLASDRVAAELLRRGLKSEDVIAVFLPACSEYLIAILGVLKAGGTYFPLATDLPEMRLRFLLDDSGSSFVMTDVAGVTRLADCTCTVLEVAATTALACGAGEAVRPGTPEPNRRAYVTYTSGSTGQPKGVEIEQGSLANFVRCCQQRFAITPGDRASMLSYVAFDMSVIDIWPTLSSGGTLVIPPAGILLEPERLMSWLAQQRITLTAIATGLIELLLPLEWPRNLSLRYVITGGDRLRVRPRADLPFVLVNGYGPTENTVLSTWFDVLADDKATLLPPIGHPLDGTSVHVLDEDLRELASGAEGELYVGGTQLARGYLGQPELTAEKFIADPFSILPGARLYRTGDWVRRLPDGALHFIGRRDDQIQIRGRRVELGEVEAALVSHPSVSQACCVPLLDDGMPAAIIAHIVAEGSEPDFVAALRSHLAPQLPDYLMPARILVHPALPLTPQGKIDRARLAATLPAESAGEARAADPADDFELDPRLVGIWRELLPQAVGTSPASSFQSLGGDSLLAMKLLLKVEQVTGVRVENSAFFADPTLAGLCHAHRRNRDSNGFDPVLPISVRAGAPPLFLLHGVSGDLEAGVALHLAPRLAGQYSVYGIRSAALANPGYLPNSIEIVAAEALAQIRRIQPHGAPILVGYSYAGLLAYEIARQLHDREGLICSIALIGTGTPFAPTTRLERLRHFCRHLPIWAWQLLRDHSTRHRRLARWRAMLEETESHLSRPQIEIQAWANGAVSTHFLRLIESYRPTSTPPLVLHLFRERGEFRPRPHPLRAWRTCHLADGGWSRWTSRSPQLLWLDADHESILQPPVVDTLGTAICRELANGPGHHS